MGKPSIKECVGNVVRIKSNKEGVQSIIETEGEETKRKILCRHSRGVRYGTT